MINFQKYIFKTEITRLILVFIFALIIRLSFSFYFQQYYFGTYQFKYSDGITYLDPIINFIEIGEYRGDLFLNDSKYFRPPIYPIFLGIIYLLTPLDLFDYIVAFIQCLIGAFSSIIVYYIFKNIFNDKKLSFFSSILFSTYPFVILWTPVMYTETLQIFLILSLIYFSTKNINSLLFLMYQGGLTGAIILTKQYLGLILIIPLSIILFDTKFGFLSKIKNLSAIMLGLIIVLSPWIARNYIQSDSIIVFFGKTSGLRNTLDDAIAFNHFANKFDENTTPHMKTVVTSGIVKFTKHVDFLKRNENDIDASTSLAFLCGGSFQERRTPSSPQRPIPYENCNQEVIQKFNLLSKKFWQEVPLWEALETRRDALWKVVSKTEILNEELVFSNRKFMVYILFIFRIIILIFGFFGLIYLFNPRSEYKIEKKYLFAILLCSLSFYIFFCLVLVSAEMRYLLTPDLLISLFACIIPTILLNKYLYLFKNQF